MIPNLIKENNKTQYKAIIILKLFFHFLNNNNNKILFLNKNIFS